MATVDFLPFSDATSGANVITQSEYAALSNLTTGFVTGIAQSNQANKVWRQSSSMVAALANVLSGAANAGAGADFLDDGNTTNLRAAIVNGLRSGNLNVGARGGGDPANSLNLTLSVAPGSYADIDGMPIRFKVLLTNTGNVVVNVNSLGSVTLHSTADLPLLPGALQANTWAEIVYSAADNIFYVLSPLGNTAFLTGQAGAVRTILTPLSGNTYAQSITFTPESIGYVLAIASVNVASTGIQPVGCSNSLYFNSTLLISESTPASMSNSWFAQITSGMVGSSQAVQQQYAVGSSGSPFYGTGINLSCIFVPGV